MRYPASEKLEIIRLVEQSHLPARRTLETLGILRSTFYRWYDRYQAGGPEALEDRSSTPRQVWNRIPDEVRKRIVDLALDAPELSPRELATRFTDTESYFVSEASVYRLLKAHDLITSPAFVVMKAADEFKDKTTAPNQLWQTDFTYLKVIGWGWFYLSTILDDFSRYIIAWKLCTTMKAEDVTHTLELALTVSGCDQARVVHKPRLLSDNGPSYVSGELAEWLEEQSMASPSDRRARIRRRHLLQVLNVDDSLKEVREKSSIEVVQTNFQHNDMRDTGPDEAKASIGDMFDKFLEDDITLGAIETKASPEMTDPGPVTRAGWTDAQDRRTSRFSVVRDSGAALATAHQVDSAVPDCCRDRSRNGRRRRARSLLVQADTDPRHNKSASVSVVHLFACG